ALEDGDTIYAVIKGTAINNDGSLKIGYTAPGIEGQARVIAEAQAVAGVDPETITYVEAHGTATPLGDPIEIAALTKAFRASTEAKGFCAIGSVKSNIGHTNAAAGVAGIIKTTLAMVHQQIPPSLHFETPNPEIDFANSPFYVNTKLSPWDPGPFGKLRAGPTPRRAGVSSFGMGGTNAHLILEEAPPQPPSGNSRPWQLIALSAKTSTALEAATENLINYLSNSPANMADVAYTLKVGRQNLKHRRVLACQDIEDAISALRAQDRERVFTAFDESSNRPVAFAFPGQGAQHVNMGLGLYQTEPTFRKHVDACTDFLKRSQIAPHFGFDLRDVLYPREADLETAAERLKQTAITQPALFTIEYALTQLWMSWGVQPQAMVGHSIGEYVAACLAGVFSLEEGLLLVATRGRMMQQLPKGSMLAIFLPEDEVREDRFQPPLLSEGLSLAAINEASVSVVSGPTSAIDELQIRLKKQDISSRRLHTSHAFHSAMMEPIISPFTEFVSQFRLQPPRIPFISNVTGNWITAGEATDPGYWASHLRQTVRFAQGVQELLIDPQRILLETGPGRTLTTL
ncbi:MAG: type I polyketide synthase, partial [Anaerolineales bacterium]